MKKISFFLSLAGLAASLCACGHDNDSYCDAGFVDGCRDGEYVRCHFEKEGSKGKLKADVSIEFNNIVYVCNNRDVLVPRDYSCSGGVLNKDGAPVDNNVVCNEDLSLVSCNGDDFVTGVQVCSNNAIISCGKDDAGAVVVNSNTCKTGMVCANYERNDKNYASCFKSSELSEGCAEGTSVLGACDGNSGLTFCTSKNPAKGQTVRLDCPSRGQSCMFINDEYGYDCSATCDDADGKKYNEHGECSNNTLGYCLIDEDGKISVDKIDCGSKTCGFNDFQYECM